MYYSDYKYYESRVSSLESEKSSLSNQINKLQEEKKLLVNEKYKNELKEFFKSQIKIIKDNINENFFEINFFDEIKINQLIEKVIKGENLEEKYIKELENIAIDNSKKINLVKHLNIILAGNTGVGKTSLINTILKYSKDECLKTAIGRPCTMEEPKYYESNKIPLLRLADTRGIEKANYKIEDLKKSIDKFIKGKLEEGNPDFFVHCIWYCIGGTRLEQIEIDTLNYISKLYKFNPLPIIIVYIQEVSDQKMNEMEEYIKSNLKFDFAPIFTIDKLNNQNKEIKQDCIDKLKHLSVIKAKEAVKSSCYEYNILDTKKKNSKNNK